MSAADDKKQERRNLNPISLSFLDVMSCGFGAVVLIFLIIDHNASTFTQTANPAIAAEIALLEEDIRRGEENLVQIRNTIADIDLDIVEAQGEARRIQEEIDNFVEELRELERLAGSSEDDMDSLRQEIARLEQELETLREAGQEGLGDNIRQFIGDGNRQYLTGLMMGGNRILIMVDISASMLDQTIVNIIRRRNMNAEARRSAPKWRQVVQTVDWLTAQLPPPSRYQIYLFNDDTTALVEGTEGRWLEVADESQLNAAIERLQEEVLPERGTNMEQAFATLRQLSPPPDNVFLITDGLPTLGTGGPTSGTVSGRDRERLFNRAVREIPAGIPFNIILAPLEGDPMAAAAFWQLAISTGGAFLTPSEDWP